MAGETIRVLARGTACAALHSAHRNGSPRFVGRRDDYELGTPCVLYDESGHPYRGVMPARVAIAEPTEFVRDLDIIEFNEQLLHLRGGDLWPFDQETADLAKVPFDPDYGGEYAKGADGKLVNVAYEKAKGDDAAKKKRAEAEAKAAADLAAAEKAEVEAKRKAAAANAAANVPISPAPRAATQQEK